ncbi:unnamed protein product [Eruca vesicaria subsp. sativa]|uniref:Uncharacterized protein n=1 Tax=Eruca vesicaria subsp. sativa TaxID=29727 RepID=A0ABC8L9Y0_ERUVS|nr:unnamed protein product [Eruca vesicaria subsp. sativa]
MAFVIYISFSAILLLLIVAIAFYLIGRKIGRREGMSQLHYGPPLASMPAPAPPQYAIEKPPAV